jgi:hypothetical protein
MRRFIPLLALFAVLSAHAQTTKVLGRKIQAAFCGDNIINGAEPCDGSALGSHSGDCTTVFGCTGGTPTCTSCVVTSVGCTGCAGADILDETFGASGSGYSASGWTEGPSGTTDEDATCPAETGGFTTQCLKTSVTGAGQKPYSRWVAAANHAEATYFTFRFYIDPSMSGVWGNGDSQMIFVADEFDELVASTTCTSGPPTPAPYPCCTGVNTGCVANAFTAAAVLELVYTTAAPPGLGQYCSGGTPPCWLIEPRIGGTGATPVPVTLGTIYEMSYKLDSGASVGEIYLNTTLLLSSVNSDDVGHGEWKYLRFGSTESAPKATTIYYMDRIKISSSNYVH